MAAVIREVEKIEVGKLREIALSRNITEARAWIIKYLIAASVELTEGVVISRGIKEIRLNSRAAQIASHGSAERVRAALNSRFIIKKAWKGNINIIIRI